MGGWTERQQAALGAVVTAILFAVAFLMAGSPPKFGGSTEEVVSFYRDHHTSILIGAVLAGLALALLIWVLAQVAVMLREAGQTTLSGEFAIAGAVTAALIGVGVGIYAAVDEVIATGGDGMTARSLYQVSQFTSGIGSWPTLLMIVAIAMAAARGVFPRWALQLNMLLALLMVLSGISVKSHGVFAAGTGLFAILGFVALLAFVLELGVLLWRKPA